MRKTILKLAVLFAAASAQAGLLSDRWATVDKWDAALAAAKKADKPIAILYGYEAVSSFYHGHAMDFFMAERSLEPFVRVVNYCEDTKGPVRNFFGLAEGTNGAVPELYLVDPKDERLIGFVDYRRSQDTAKIAKQVASVVKWRAGVDKDIIRADRAAEQGKYKEALRILKDVAEEDGKTSKAVETQLGVEYDPARKPTAGAPRNVGTTDKDKPNPPDANDKAAADDKDAKKEAKATFFPNLFDTKRTAYAELASKRLSAAKVELEQKAYAKARAQLQPMLTDNSDLPQIAEAKQLMETINAAEKVARSSPMVK